MRDHEGNSKYCALDENSLSIGGFLGLGFQQMEVSYWIEHVWVKWNSMVNWSLPFLCSSHLKLTIELNFIDKRVKER